MANLGNSTVEKPLFLLQTNSCITTIETRKTMPINNKAALRKPIKVTNSNRNSVSCLFILYLPDQ